MSSAGYVINVGRERPEKVIVAHVNTKNGEPIENTKIETTIGVGRHLIINRCSVWGARYILDKDQKKSYVNTSGGAIEFNTPGYAGLVEFLPWGNEKGSSIEIRYLTQSRSLDVEYQENIQKVKINSNTDGAAQIELFAGQNKFDLKTQALLIQFLKVHPQNRESKSKNPEPMVKGHTFYEITDDMVDQGAIHRMESMIDVGYLIKSLAEKPESIRNIFNLMLVNGVDFGQQTDEKSLDREIYTALLNLAQNHGSEMSLYIDQFKHQISDSFEYAKASELIDTTKDNVIVFENNSKKEMLFTEAEGKGGKQIDWVLENYHDKDVYGKVKEFIKNVQKLK